MDALGSASGVDGVTAVPGRDARVFIEDASARDRVPVHDPRRATGSHPARDGDADGHNDDRRSPARARRDCRVGHRSRSNFPRRGEQRCSVGRGECRSLLLQRTSQAKTFQSSTLAQAEREVRYWPLTLVHVDVDDDTMTLGVDPATAQIRAVPPRTCHGARWRRSRHPRPSTPSSPPCSPRLSPCHATYARAGIERQHRPRKCSTVKSMEESIPPLAADAFGAAGRRMPTDRPTALSPSSTCAGWLPLPRRKAHAPPQESITCRTKAYG